MEIPGAVKTIEDASFAECGKLEALELPNRVAKFGNSVFSECEKLENVTFLQTSTEIEKRATEIGERAFEERDALFRAPSPFSTVPLTSASVAPLSKQSLSFADKFRQLLLKTTSRPINNTDKKRILMGSETLDWELDSKKWAKEAD